MDEPQPYKTPTREEVLKWDVDATNKWFEQLRPTSGGAITNDDVQKFKRINYSGKGLLDTSKEELVKLHQLSGGAAAAIVGEIKNIVEPPFVPPFDNFVFIEQKVARTRTLSKPAFTIQTEDLDVLVHVPVPGEEDVANAISVNKDGGGQRKNIGLGIGDPRSGKSQLCRMVIPHYLKPLGKYTRTLFVDLSYLKRHTTLAQKLKALYDLLTRVIEGRKESIVLDEDELEDGIFLVLRKLGGDTVVVFDEYQFAFHGLKLNEAESMGTVMRNLMIGEEIKAQFIVTGSVNAATAWSIGCSLVNGIDLSKAPFVIRTPRDSTDDELRDTFALLEELHPHIREKHLSVEDTIKAVRGRLGEVNCARFTLIIQNLASIRGANVDTAVDELLRRVFGIYDRDLLPLLEHNPRFRDLLASFADGTASGRNNEWKHVTKQQKLKGGGYIVTLDDPLLAAWVQDRTERTSNDEVKLRDRFRIEKEDFRFLAPISRFRLIGEHLSQVKKDQKGKGEFEAKVEQLGTELHGEGFGGKEVFWKELNLVADKLAKEKWAKFSNRESSARGETHAEALRLIRNIFSHDRTVDFSYTKQAYEAVLKYYARGNPALVMHLARRLHEVFTEIFVDRFD